MPKGRGNYSGMSSKGRWRSKSVSKGRKRRVAKKPNEHMRLRPKYGVHNPPKWKRPRNIQKKPM